MLTLLPPQLAAEGFAFTFQGANTEECEGCPFTTLCFKLTPGRHYAVTKVRDVTHPCNLHDGDKVQVVEVEEAPFTTSLEAKLMRGTASTWKPIACGRPVCPSYHLCHPRVEANVQYQIAEDLGKLECPEGFDLRTVRLQR